MAVGMGLNGCMWIPEKALDSSPIHLLLFIYFFNSNVLWKQRWNFSLKIVQTLKTIMYLFCIPTLAFHPQFFMGQPFFKQTFAVEINYKDHVAFQEIIVSKIKKWRLNVNSDW